MEKRIANNFIVGLFVALGFFGFIFIVFNISGGRGVFSNDYFLYGKFHHVKGLNFGSEVSLAGLRIGTVKKIDVVEGTEKQLVVELAISRDMMNRVREDSIATIKTSGILGDKYIEISIGSQEVPPLKPDSSIRTEEPADLFSKTSGFVENFSRHFTEGSEFEHLIKNLNETAQNLSLLTSELREHKGLWHELVRGSSGENLSRSTRHLEGILRKIEAGEGTLGAIINDPTVYEDIKALLSGARRSSVLKYFMKSFIEEGQEEKKK